MDDGWKNERTKDWPCVEAKREDKEPCAPPQVALLILMSSGNTEDQTGVEMAQGHLSPLHKLSPVSCVASSARCTCLDYPLVLDQLFRAMASLTGLVVQGAAVFSLVVSRLG